MFDVTGYDIVATMLYAEHGGEVLVLCNNSSHYLVAVRPGDAEPTAQYERSFRYQSAFDTGRLPSAERAYCNALRYAVDIACRR